MKYAYPAANQLSKLTHPLLSIKVARHSPCASCDACTGLRPPPGVEVIFDDFANQTSIGDLGQYGSDDDDASAPYLDTCACSHTVNEHGADELEVGPEEFARRSRVAIRLDELLQVSVLLALLHWDAEHHPNLPL